jgi:zinc transporter 9
MKCVALGNVIFTVSVSALPSTKKYDAVVIAHQEHTSSSDVHSLIGISLVLGFVFMLLVDQCSVSRSRGKLTELMKNINEISLR